MRLISYLIIGLTLFLPCAYASPPSPPNPAQVSAGEITAGTETGLRSYSPADVVSFISTHGGSDAFTVKVDAAATAAYLYDGGSGAVRAGTNVTIDDDGNYITINASLAGGAVDTEGTLNADEIAVMHDLDTIKSLTEAEFKAAYNMEAGTDYLAPDGVGTSLTALNGENIQDDTIDDDSLDFSNITLDDFVSAENDYISVATDDTFDFTREDSGSVVITASDDDANAALIVRGGGTGSLTLGGASNTSIMVLTDGGNMVLDGYISIGTDPADAGVIRLENATAIAWEDATETTLTHVDNTGLSINTGLAIGGTLDANGVVTLGDGGDNFSVASDGIDIDTSGNVSNAGTIACGKVTSSAAFESATGLFDVTGAAAITVGSADVTAITLQTDDTGDGTDLVLPAQSVNGSEMLNNTVTATQLSATITLSDGDVFDFSGITHTGSTDEGLALPTWANVTPTSDKPWAAWDGTNQILKIYDGGWVSISPSGAPTDATYLTLSVDATLSDERVLTESTQGIDFTDGGAGSTLTVSLDFTEVDSFTFSDGANATNVITFDVSGTDTTLTAGSDIVTFSDDVSAETFIPSEAAAAAGEFGYNTNAFSWFANSEDLTMTASSNTWTFGTGTGVTLVDFGAIGLAGGSFDASDGNITNVGSIALDSITADGSAIAIGGGTETVAIDSSDWDISTTGAITGVAFDANGTGNTLTNINAADHADEDWGDFSVSSGSFTLDADVVGTAEMADADHGHVAWSSGSATVEDFAVSAEATVADDIAIRFGGAATDWYAEFDDSVDDQMLWHTTATAAVETTDPMFEILADFGTSNGTGMTANQQIFGVAKGTQASNVALLTLDEDGDFTVNGSITSTASGQDSYVELSSNASSVESSNRLYFVANELHCSEAGDDDVILTQDDGSTLTGTTWSFASVTNMILPTTAADASGEISMSTGNQLKWHDGTKVVTIDTTPTNDDYVLKYDNATATFTLEADETGGTPTINSVGDATAASDIVFDATAETLLWQFTSAYTTGPQFLIQQVTGNPTGGTLLEVRGADSDSGVLEVGDGTNVWTVSTAGLLTNAGTATLNLAAASDLTVGGGQIDYDDMAGSGNISTSGSITGGTVTDGTVTLAGDGTITGLSAGGLPDNTVNSADINTIVDSIAWNAAGMNVDGTQCADPSAVQINSGPYQHTIICADNDGSTMYGHVVMPDSWNGGTVTFEGEYLQTAADTNALNSDVAMQCRGAGETVNNTWGTEQALDDAGVTGSNAVDHTTTAAITPDGTCAAGDTLYWRWQLDATGTTTAVATLHFLGAKIEYTSNVGD